MDRTISALLMILLAAGAKIHGQSVGTAAERSLRSIDQKQREISRTPQEALIRVLMRPEIAGQLQLDERRSSTLVRDIAVCDITVDAWLRLRATADPTHVVIDEGYEPSEFKPADLAHATELHRGLLNDLPLLGRGILLAVYDSGIDWRHEAFKRDADTSAIALIWDQTETLSGAFPPPPGRDRGRTYDRTMIAQALSGLRSDVTTADRTGHGTMVAAAALALAPGTDLVIIKGGDDRFSDSGLLESLAFLDSLALAWNRPVVLNLSLGSQRGPHDGSTILERAIESFSSRPGRFVVAAAGNAGGSGIHAEGTTPFGSGPLEVPMSVPAGGEASGDGLDMEVWFADTAGIHVDVVSPSGRVQSSLSSGVVATVDDEGVMVIDRPAGGRLVTVQLSDIAGVDPLPGVYRLRVRGGTAFHAWITRSRFGMQAARFLPEPGVVTDRGTVQSPANSAGALAVGATELIDDQFTPAAWNSAGPSADGRLKPEISASGSIWLGSLGRRAFGTSVSAPIVAGVVALLFETMPQATGEEVRSALTGSATGPSRQVDAAAAVASLLQRRSFPPSFISLFRPTASMLSWNGERLEHAERYALVDRATMVPIAVWPAGDRSNHNVGLMDWQVERLDAGRATLAAHDRYGRAISFDLPGGTPEVPTEPVGPSALAIGAHPNPFNASTTITMDLPAEGLASVSVYSVDGREVARLHDGPVKAGRHRWAWASTMASGVYFVRSEYRTPEGGASGRVGTMKLVMLR